MSRITRYKIGYVIVLLALIVGLITFSSRIEPWSWQGVAVIVALLVPGRLQGLLFRDLFRGRRDLDRNDAASALTHFNSFLAKIQAQPWRKPAIWLSWSLYTPDVEAMAQNNIGSAHLRLENLALAEVAWNAALALDPQYALPHANLALVAATRNDAAETQRHLDAARALGYRGEGFDRFIRKTQSILAAAESHGPAA